MTEQDHRADDSPPPVAPRPTVSALSVVSLTLSASGFVLAIASVQLTYRDSVIGLAGGMALGCVGLALGLLARRRIKARPEQFRAPGLAKAAMVAGALQVGLVVLGMNFVPLRAAAYDSVARSVGINNKIREKVYYYEHGSYSNDLKALRESFPSSIVEDPEITFVFGPCDAEGYTFTTQHLKGDRSFRWTGVKPEDYSPRE